MDPLTLARVVVVGASGSGKSTCARALAARLGHPYVQLDALFWGPDWQAVPHAEFARRVEAATAHDRWVVDGNYSAARDVVWRRATAIVWLNVSFPVAVWRVLHRTVRRSVSGEALYAGNRESLARAFLSRESIILWVLTSYHRRRKEFAALRAHGPYAGLAWVELRRGADVQGFLAGIVPPLTVG